MQIRRETSEDEETKNNKSFFSLRRIFANRSRVNFTITYANEGVKLSHKNWIFDSWVKVKWIAGWRVVTWKLLKKSLSALLFCSFEDVRLAHKTDSSRVSLWKKEKKLHKILPNLKLCRCGFIYVNIVLVEMEIDLVSPNIRNRSVKPEKAD